jgi:uncharacterized protein
VSTNVEKLLVIQDRDRKIGRLAREINDLPERRRMIESQLDAHKKALEAAEDVIRKKGLEQKELEAQIEQRKERIQKLRQQQFEVKNNDDYRAFEHQIESVNKDILAIEERELVMMEAVEAANAVRDEKIEALKSEETIVNEELARFKERAANIEKELIELETKRRALAEDMDPDWLARYDRIFKHHGDFALVTVEHNTCGGCHMKLPPQLAHDARKLDSMTTCMYCGRLLYFIP